MTGTKRRNLLVPLAAAMILAAGTSIFASASGSIGNLHTEQSNQVTVKDLDDSNTAQVLGEAGIFPARQSSPSIMMWMPPETLWKPASPK